MAIKEKHRSNIMLLAAIVTIGGLGYLVYEHLKNSNSNTGPSLGANPITAMSTGIPVFEINSAGGSQAVSGVIGANPIGNSRRGEQPLGGFMDYTGPRSSAPLEGPGSGTVWQQLNPNPPANVANVIIA